MALRIATWNVNSIRQRMASLGRFLAETGPDVLCLQETKATDADFPIEAVRALGYRHLIIRGEKSYNGVAILSRRPFQDQGHRLWCKKQDCRHLFVTLEGGIELHNFYVPSGGDKPDPKVNEKFDHKLKFLRAMARWARKENLGSRKIMLVGDLNVAPLEKDVWNHKRLLRSVGHTPVESELMGKLRQAANFIDVPRHFVPSSEPLYTWWGYRFPQAFQKNYGWHLDHVLVTEALATSLKAMRVAKETRSWEKPSDHVPVVVDLA